MISRRGFVRGAAAGLPVLLAGGAEAQAPPAPPLDDALLRAVGEVVLPTALGDVGLTTTIATFLAWLAAYEPVAERNHGYGTGEIGYLPADPAPGWNAQLRALELEAQRRHGRGFAALDVTQRRALIARHLRGDRIPPPLEAEHVALGLLAWWCDSPAAHDLACRARIAPRSCRPLATTADVPPAYEGDT